MKATISLASALLLAHFSCMAEDARAATCAADIARATAMMETNVAFAVKATVAYVPQKAVMGIVDSSGAATLTDFLHTRFGDVRAGDVISASGVTRISADSLIPTAECDRISVLAHGEPPKPHDITARDFSSGRFDHMYVRIKGVVRDTFIDEIDPRWVFLVLGTEQGSLFAAFKGKHPALFNLEGAEISISGLCEKHRIPQKSGSRHVLRRILGSAGVDSIEVLRHSPKDQFDVPDLESVTDLSPEEIAVTGRRRTTGRVLAVWGGRNMLLASDRQNDVVLCKLKEARLPACGDVVEALGLPETDLFRINLSRAVWRRAGAPCKTPDEQPKTIGAEQIFTDDDGKPKIQTRFHGHPVTLRGLVRSIPAEGSPECRIYLESGRFTIPVDVSAAPDIPNGLSIGCEVAVTGICITEIGSWDSHSPFPHIREVFLVPRAASDVTVIRRPPWWSPRKLLVALASLAFILLGILIWNLSLRRLAELRGRQLAEEHIARAETDMKVLERTRLAVELHDSVAQNLTGVAMELETARQFQNGAHPELLNHLGIAWRTLKSCRNELRNCLWDLRSRALEEPDMETAVQRTLLPHIKGVKLLVRFHVPRERISDNTAHAILRIIRELALNGIHHGGAGTIRIAGGIEGDVLRFSVRDDGCGFVPQDRPGVEDGHFGLQGILERVSQLGGRMTIESRPGCGTKVAIVLHMPKG